MANPYQRRLEKLETSPANQERYEEVNLRLMRYEIERRSVGWEHNIADCDAVERIWERIQRHPKFPEMDAAVRRGERLICQPTVGAIR